MAAALVMLWCMFYCLCGPLHAMGLRWLQRLVYDWCKFGCLCSYLHAIGAWPPTATETGESALEFGECVCQKSNYIFIYKKDCLVVLICDHWLSEVFF